VDRPAIHAFHFPPVVTTLSAGIAFLKNIVIRILGSGHDDAPGHPVPEHPAPDRKVL
jgi:hypothetical protein